MSLAPLDAATLYGLMGAILVGLGLYGVVLLGGFLRRLLAFNLLGGGVFILFGVVARRGAGAGFGGDPVPQALVITGIVGGYRGRGLGRLLKQHQREWALGRDVHHITWTFDPLVARNASFNLRVLGARVGAYFVDHYGAMDDGVNRGDETDRIFAVWDLDAPAAPPREQDIVTTVEVPADIERLRREAPGEALDWRYRVREAFLGLTEDGFRVAGFDDRGYLFVREGVTA